MKLCTKKLSNKSYKNYLSKIELELNFLIIRIYLYYNNAALSYTILNRDTPDIIYYESDIIRNITLQQIKQLSLKKAKEIMLIDIKRINHLYNYNNISYLL